MSGGIVRARRAATLVIVALVVAGASMLHVPADRNAMIMRPVGPPAEVARRGDRRR